MLHVKISQSRYFGVLVFHTLVLLSMIHSCRAHSKVIGPSKPILAIVGEDITLPCYLDPVMDAFGMTLEWARPDLTPRFVLVWRDGVELESKKHGSYEGRTSLLSDELKHGNISLKLSKVKISDEGRYRCFIPELGTDSTVQLVVGAVSSPVIQKSKNSSSMLLQCESAGWHPEPEVFWLDGEGNLLSAGPTETVRGPDDLYTVSSRVTVEKRHSNSFTCRVQQKDINQTRETHIQVTDDFFPVQSDSGSSSSTRTVIGLVVAMLILAAVFVVVWKWRQNKTRNKKHHEDGETQKVREEKSNSVRNNSEQEPLMETETDKEQLAAERETINNQDTFSEETELQTQGQTENGLNHEEEAKSAPHPTESDLNQGEEAKSAPSPAESNLNHEEEAKSAPSPAESDLNHEEEAKLVRDNTEQLMEERQAENNLQIEEEKIKSAGDETRAQCLMEEEKNGEQLTAERETLTDLDKEKAKLMRKLKTKDREQEEFEKRVSRLEGLMKEKEKQMQQLKEQLEEVERQRGEAERKLQSVNREEDKMDLKTQREAAGKDEAVRILSDTKNDLERKKAELQEQLQKMETELERQKREERGMRQRKIKAANEKEDIIKTLTEMKKQRKEKLQDTLATSFRRKTIYKKQLKISEKRHNNKRNKWKKNLREVCKKSDNSLRPGIQKQQRSRVILWIL